MQSIRNISIIAHIDHGKSTLADRMLELTGTVEKRRMREQVLDSMELERERGITIKMAPVTMRYSTGGAYYSINVIDTPGHIDFSYEVSRALKAVEGVILLVDATQGIQAQTLSVLDLAREQKLVIIPAVSKIDSPRARPDEVAHEVAEAIGIAPEAVYRVSGKTGEGVTDLLNAVIQEVPPPVSTAQRDGLETGTDNSLRALVFDFTYSNHRGITVHARIFDGTITKRDTLSLKAAGTTFSALEVGHFGPDEQAAPSLSAGEVGYIVTGVKSPGIAAVGDTIVAKNSKATPLAGYREPKPVVWASVFPEDADDFEALRQALERLRLSDAALSYEEEASSVLGRGFRCGFLGMLHLEIVIERLRREFQLVLVVTTPSVTYEVSRTDDTTETVYSPARFPEHGQVVSIKEPWVSARIITTKEQVSSIVQLLHEYEAVLGQTETFGTERLALSLEMPLRELYRGFFDALKGATAGYASLSYDIIGMRPADVVRLDVLVAEEPVPAFARVIARAKLETEARSIVGRLHEALPRQLFATKIQAQALGRIVASKTLPALRKDVTGHLYGGDVTRKKKLLEKQKKGKKKMRERGKVHIPQEVFLKMVKD